MRNALSFAGLGILGTLAVAGWVHNPRPAAAAAPQPQYADMQTAPVPVQYSTAANYAPAVNYVPVQYNPNQEYAPRYTYRDSYRDSAPDQSYGYSRYRVRRERPFSHSAAIVGGGAAAGAAMGALVGHGKGAAIGALSGGVAGFIYDRATHNRADRY